MQQELYLHIPTPCHEDWDTMTPVQKGKFCGSCNKEVVDFSLMTDAEVLNFFKKSTGNTCGRFYNDQLQRPLQETKIEKKKGWKLVLASISSLLMMVKVTAQKKVNTSPKGEVTAQLKPSIQPIIVGDTVINTSCIPKPILNNVIKGVVLDENKQPVAFATVLIKGTKTGTATDANGVFSLKINNTAVNNTIVISSVGFETKEIVITPKQLASDQKIELKMNVLSQVLGGVVIATHQNRTITISGRVVDEKNHAIAGASIFERDCLAGVADENGNFKITSHTLQDTLPIKVSSIGFEDEKATIDLIDDEVYAKVKMKTKDNKLPEVVVVSGYTVGKLMGAIGYCTKVTKKDTTLSTIRKVLDNSAFTVVENPLKVYPNPAIKNSSINLVIKDAGTYDIQLFDLQSKLLKFENVTTETKKQTVPFQLPNTSSGNFFIRINNQQTKKSYTEKIVIQ